MKSTFRWITCACLTAVWLGSGVSLTACSKKKPNDADSAVSNAKPDEKSGIASTNSGQQIGMSDGSPDGAPTMTGAAKTAYQEGLAAWARGDLQAARQGFLKAIDADPKAHQAHYSLGVIQERLGDPSAVDSYRKAYSLKPGYEPAIVAYGMALAHKEKLKEAEEFLTQRKEKMPKSAPVLAALAEVKSLKGDTGTAQQLAQEALKINPDYRPAMMVLARDHYRHRRVDLTLYALEAILDGHGEASPARDKNNAEAHLLRAVIYKEREERNEALKEFEVAVKLRPDFVDAQVQLAAYYLQAGNATTALPHLETAIKYNKEHLIAHLNLGDAYRLLGKIPEAKKEFEWVLTKDSNRPQVHYNLGLLFMFSDMKGVTEKQRYEKAVSSFEQFQKLRGKPSPGVHDDSDQLLLRAKTKLAAIEAIAAAKKAAAKAKATPSATPATPPPATSGAKPATSSSASTPAPKKP
jgi:Tfp pilus assembly protein PilF